jgi:uncharacterized protein (DUF362 family)
MSEIINPAIIIIDRLVGSVTNGGKSGLFILLAY